MQWQANPFEFRGGFVINDFVWKGMSGNKLNRLVHTCYLIWFFLRGKSTIIDKLKEKNISRHRLTA